MGEGLKRAYTTAHVSVHVSAHLPSGVKVGDWLKDNDPRCPHRKLCVIVVGDTHVICDGPPRVSIAIRRIFDDGKTRRSGFTLLTPKESK